MEISDDELVISVLRNDDNNSFDRLVRKHQGVIFYTLLKLTNDHALAEDLAQNTLFLAYKKLNQYQLGRSFKAWLGGIAYNQYLQAMRADQSEKKKVTQYAEQSIYVESDSINESSLDLDNGLSKLNEDEKSILLLSYALGLSNAEIASLVGMPVGTVKSKIRRGKEKLHSALSE